MSGHIPRSTALAPLIALFLSVSCAPLDDSHPIVQFSRGQRLEDLPGHTVLHPEGLRQVINITLTPATLKVGQFGVEDNPSSSVGHGRQWCRCAELHA